MSETSAPAPGALVYARGEDADALMRVFVTARRAEGLRVGGVLQSMRQGECAAREAFVTDIGSGAALPIFQDLGPHAISCRADAEALTRAGAMLTRALAARPDILVISRFGKLEAEGGGMRDEIAAAVLSGTPVLIGVAERHIGAWQAFTEGHSTRLPCAPAALEAWWRGAAAPPATLRRSHGTCI